MKSVLKLLSLFFVMSFFIVACSDDDTPSDPCDGVSCSAGEECQNGTCVDTTTSSGTCDACGNYSGTVSSDGDSVTFLPVAGQGLDNEVLEPTPFTAEVTENANSSDSLDMVVTLELSVAGQTASVPVEITVSYDDATNEFEGVPNQDVSLQATIPGLGTIPVNVKLVEFSGTVDGTDVAGVITVDDQDPQANDDYDATLTFAGTLD